MVVLGEGNLICNNAILTTNVRLKDFNLIYFDCTVAHDCEIGDFCTISPGVHLSGNVTLKDKVFLGTGSVVNQMISICSNAVIGSGAAVVRDISEPGIMWVCLPER